MSDKPAILQDSEFTVEEGLAYRACRTGAIWMNKLFFSSLVLLAVWIAYASLGGIEACSSGVDEGNLTDVPAVDEGSCSAFLNQTSLYLGAMAVISFLLSIVFGLLGLVVGKRIIEATKASEEVGAPRDAESDRHDD